MGLSHIGRNNEFWQFLYSRNIKTFMTFLEILEILKFEFFFWYL